MATHVASGERVPLTQVYEVVRGMIDAGSDDAAIVAELGAQGMSREQATGIVHTLRAKSGQSISSHPITGEGSGQVLLSVLMGAGAAVVSGIVWGLIVVTTHYEVGFVAWGIGLFCGFAVAFASGHMGGMAFQAIAVASSFFGIAIGKYFAFVDMLKTAVTEEVGAEAALQVTYFSSKVVSSLFENFGSVFGFYDLLWIFLAVSTAAKMNMKKI